MEIDYARFICAVDRLARRKLRNKIVREGLLVSCRAEHNALLRRAMRPRSAVSLAWRLKQRGHSIGRPPDFVEQIWAKLF